MFFNYTATTEIYTLPLHDALPILGPAIFKNSDAAKWNSQVAIIENPDLGQFTDGGMEIDQDAWEARDQFLGWNIVSPLGDTHRHALAGHLGSGDSDIAEDRGVACLCGRFEKRHLLAHRV